MAKQPATMEAPAEALQLQAYEFWLKEEETKRFFAALRARKVSIMDAAARNAGRTGPQNAFEHNNLVKASELLYILETYEHPSSYPFPSAKPNPSG